MNSSLALSTQEQTEGGHFLSHQYKEEVKCMAVVLGGYRSVGLCIHWSVSSKLCAGWGPSAETVVKCLGLQKGPGDVCCLSRLFLWVLCLLYALATFKARNRMFWKEKVGKPPWQINALSLCAFICSCPLFFDHYGSIAFKCCGVSLVTHNSVVVCVTAAIHMFLVCREMALAVCQCLKEKQCFPSRLPGRNSAVIGLFFHRWNWEILLKAFCTQQKSVLLAGMWASRG